MTRPTRREFERWCVTTVVSFGMNLGLTVVFTEYVGFPAPASFAIALAFVLVGNFLAVRYFIYEIDHLPLGTQAVRFGLLTAAFRLAEWSLFTAIHSLGALDYRLLLVIILASSSLTKFVTYRQWLSR